MPKVAGLRDEQKCLNLPARTRESIVHSIMEKWPPPKLKILCLGAHPDDIEIGCGGTILRFLASIREVEMRWVVFGATAKRKKEAIASAGRFLRAAKIKKIDIRGFRESFLPYQGEAIKREFEKIKRSYQPDIIFTHYRHDLHQDHRIVNEFTWNTFRNHLILEYEIPKYDGDLGVPNTFIQLGEDHCTNKVRNLMECFPSQQTRHWFTEDTFFALLRLRGIESGGTTRYAEAFYCRKHVW